MSLEEEDGPADREPHGTRHLTEVGAVRARQARGVLYVLVAAFAVGIIGIGIWNLDWGGLSSRSGGESETALSGEDTNGEAASGTSAFAPGDLAGEPFNIQLQEAASGISAPAPEESEEDPDVQQARSDYLARARLFEEQLDPALDAISLGQWAPELARNIQESRERALQEFTAGSYAVADGLLAEAEITAREAVKTGETRFRQHLDQASDSFEASDPVQAERHISRALQIKPGDAEAQALRGRIEVLPEIVKLMETAARARAQNDSPAERAALEQVLRLDPMRAEVEDRYRQLARDAAEREFGAIVLEGMRAVQESNLAAAEQALGRVRKLAPGREEVALLEKEVRHLQRKIQTARFLAEGESLAVGDDWRGARDAFRKVLKIDASNADAQSGLELAERMVAADERITGYLQRPGRLSTDNIAAAARTALEDARILSVLGSKRLAELVRQLEDALRVADIEIAVIVRSDNMTEIIVRGTGRVGLITEKVISLRPGTYLFEGKREGYRSKLVELVVAVGSAAPVEVTVVCDERI